MITELQSELSVRMPLKQLERRMRLLTIKTRKLARARVRRTRSICLVWYRRQYFFSDAYADMRGHINRNEDIFIAMAIIAAVLSYAFASTAANFLLLFFQSAYLVADMTQISLPLLSLLVFAVPAVLSAWLLAFTCNSFSFTIIDSASRKQYRSVRSTLRRSLRYTSRFTLDWLTILLAAALPIGIIGLIGVTLVYFNVLQPDLLSTLMPWLLGAGTAWLLGCLSHCALVPYVRLFEQQPSLIGAFMRSRQLVQKRGRIFLSLFFLIVGGLLTSLSLGSYLLGSYGAVYGSILALLIVLFANMLLVTFYYKRRLARVN